MRVAIESRVLSYRGGGVKTYVENLIDGLGKIQDIDLLLIRTEAGEHETGKRESVVVPMRWSFLLGWWLQVLVPKRIIGLKVDLVHFTKADVPNKLSVPCIVTIYDVIPLLFGESQTFFKRWYWERALSRAAHKSDKIITISQASKKDIVRLLGVREEKIVVTPLAADLERFRVSGDESGINKVKSRYGIGNSYILFVGTRDKRKNIGAIISAYEKVASELDCDLVIAGKKADKEDDSEALIKQSKFKGRIKEIDFVEDEYLPYLYEGAEVFVWPSIYEGWGLPPMEAMASGVPVIVSNGGSLPEVVGEAGRVVEYESVQIKDRLGERGYVDDLAHAIKEVVTNKELRGEMIASGLGKVKESSWEKVAQVTRQTYQDLLRGND